MAMTLTGFVYDNAGNAISGATVQGYVSADNATTTAESSTTTDSNGKWSITTSTASRIPMDVKITYGSNVRWIKAGDKVNITDMTVTGTLTVGEDAAGFDFSLFSSDTSGDGLTWDASEEVLQITGKDGNTSLDVLDGDVRIVDKLYFYDRGGEYLSSDGSTLTITGATTVSGGLTSTAASNTLGATSFNDADITNVGDIALDSISADGTDINVAVSDNSATALTVKQGSDAYLIIDTANSSESVSIGTGISGTAITLGHSTSEVTVADNLTVTGNLTVSGTQTIVDTVTMNAANAVVFEGATADDYETTLTIEDPTADRTVVIPNVSGTLAVLAADSDTAITSTPAELNILDGATVVVGEINALDLGSTAVGNAIASKAVVLDSNLDYTGIRNFTITGELDAATLDISGDADVDGTLEADAYTVDGTALNEYIADTVGAMFTSNTETRITATYQDADNTIDLVVDDMSSDSDTTYTPGDGLDLSGTEFSVDLKTNGGLEIQSTELSVAQGISQYDVAQFAAGVADNDFLRIDGTSVEGLSAAEVAAAIEGSIDAVGALDGGSITSNFGNIDIGSSTFDTTGAVTTGNLSPAGDVAIADAKYIKLGGSRMATAEPNTNQTGYGVVIGFDSAGSVSLGDAVYINSSGKVAQANAQVGSVTDPVIGIATNAGGSDGDDVYVLTHGIWRMDAEAFTAGDPVYLGESAGALTATAPSTDGDYVQRIGIAVSDDCVLVMPSIDVIEHA